ncbi:MAG: cache domain-containing protein [Campylobacterales bacterium]
MRRLFANRSINQINLLGALFAGLFIAAFAGLMIYDEYQRYRHDLDEISTSYLAEQKAAIVRETKRALRFIDYKYRKYRHLPRKDLERHIVEAVEQMRDERDGSGYVFIYTFEGVNVADPILKQNAGKNLINFTDPKGKKVIKELIEVSKHPEGGFVEYVWNKPTTGKLAPKISYAKAYEPLGWMVGSGVYLDDVQKEIDARRQAYETEVLNFIYKLLILALVIVIVVGLLSHIYSWLIGRDVSRIREFFAQTSKGYARLSKEDFSIREFREIAEHADAMAEAIRIRDEALKQLNAGLEEKVREKTAKLERAKEFAESLVAAQDRFVKNAIHEINTPLAIIQTNIDLMRFKGERSPHLAKIEAAIKIITTVYEDLAYFVRRDRLVVRKELINLSAAIRERVDYFREIAEANHLKLLLDVAEELYVHMDSKQLQRLIDNNLSNAIKYAKEGSSIEVRLSRREEGIDLEISNESHTTIDASDVFERYKRGSSARGGFGIGLSLVAQICVENGITYVARNEGERVVFTYVFPDAYDHVLAYR